MAGWVQDRSGQVFWGKKASGLLFVRKHPKEGPQMLLLLRGPRAHNPNTWGVVGGAVEEGEDEFISALRETAEEIDSIPSYRQVKQQTWQQPGGDFTYTTFILEVQDLDWTPKPVNWENKDAQWVSIEQANEMSLHPGFRDTLKSMGSSIYCEQT